MVGVDEKVVLSIKDLTVKYPCGGFSLKPVSFDLCQGEMTAIIGESGSGKTTLMMSVLGLLSEKAEVHGHVDICGYDILSLNEKELDKLRMKVFSIAFQNSGDYLNPALTLKEQIYEVLRKKFEKHQWHEKACEIFEKVGLLKDDLDRYPKELSGGMVQKFLIACAIVLEPKLIVLDEPTSALDPSSADGITELLGKICTQMDTAVLLVTHDLTFAKKFSQNVIVMYEGVVLEAGKTEDIFEFQRHPYTRGLFNSDLELNRARDIWGIRNLDGSMGCGCPFYGRCTQSIAVCENNLPELKECEGRLIACNRGGIVKNLECRQIQKSYGGKQILLGADLSLYSGETVTIIGKSGSGKTTFANIAGGFLGADSGEVLFDGEAADFKALHKMKNGVQMVFQDSESGLNRHFTVFEAVSEPLLLSKNNDSMEDSVKKALYDVGLQYSKDFLNQKIHTLSGGQKQRISLARALTMEPRVMIADELTSMLDASNKANVIRLLKGIQNKRGFSMLMITHDIVCAEKISDRIYELNHGILLKFA